MAASLTYFRSLLDVTLLIRPSLVILIDIANSHPPAAATLFSCFSYLYSTYHHQNSNILLNLCVDLMLRPLVVCSTRTESLVCSVYHCIHSIQKSD